MKTFETELKELMENTDYNTGYGDICISQEELDEFEFKVIMLKNRYCLDKEKVREAIRNLWSGKKGKDEIILFMMNFKDELLKELEL